MENRPTHLYLTLCLSVSHLVWHTEARLVNIVLAPATPPVAEFSPDTGC